MTRTLALLAALLMSGGVAGSFTPSPILLVTFEQPAHVHVNARAPSTVTLSSGTYLRQVALTGTPDPLDPEGNLSRLDALRLRLPLKTGATLIMKARLFVCDDKVGICRVKEQQMVVPVVHGVIRLTLKVGAQRELGR